MGLILLILVATDASAFVCYITRFTEENFACLIAFIFIKKAIEKLIHIHDHYPIHESECFCRPDNETLLTEYGTSSEFISFNLTKPYKYPCEFETDNGILISGLQSVGCHYVPNAFLMSVLLFIGTFLISYHLKGFKSASFFPAKVRGVISDFAVIIAILSMCLVDFLVNVDTPKLKVPGSLRPTWSGRGWLIDPIGSNPYYTPIAAIVPALLGTILIFMDQQITAVIVNRKEHKLEVIIHGIMKLITPSTYLSFWNIAERRWLSSWFVDCDGPHRDLFHIWPTLVRGSDRVVHQPRQISYQRVRNCCSRWKAPVSWNQVLF